MRKLAQEKNIAVVMSLHELDMAEKISDYVMCVREGEIFRSGRPEEIFRPEVICELFGLSRELYAAYFSK